VRVRQALSALTAVDGTVLGRCRAWRGLRRAGRGTAIPGCTAFNVFDRFPEALQDPEGKKVLAEGFRPEVLGSPER